jgi:hypothetical protein
VVNETLAIPGLSSGIVDIAAGETHVCVLTATGTVMCWGDGAGELNVGGWQLSASPAAVNLGGTAVDIASGDGFSCAVRSDGNVLCWGSNVGGELGNGTHTDSDTPVLVTGLPSSAVGVWADQATHPCAILSDGSVWCWGDVSTTGAPTTVTGFAASATALTTGSEYAGWCALLSTTGVQCWGDGYTSPTTVLAAGSGVVELRSVDYDFCALLGTGAVSCWVGGGGGYGWTAPFTVSGL